jgi:hypothetical protein
MRAFPLRRPLVKLAPCIRGNQLAAGLIVLVFLLSLNADNSYLALRFQSGRT